MHVEKTNEGEKFVFREDILYFDFERWEIFRNNLELVFEEEVSGYLGHSTFYTTYFDKKELGELIDWLTEVHNELPEEELS